MKRFFLLFLFLFSSSFISAHKPKVRAETFGNVKTYFVSDFNFAPAIESEELKIKIIGNMSKVIAERLNYRDTIMIEYKVSSYYDEERKLYILENKSSQYKIPFLDGGVVSKSNGTGLAVRIINEKVDVSDILKLVEFAILNKENLNKYLISSLFYCDEECNKVLVLKNSEEFINKIILKESKLVDQIINEEFILLDNGSLRTQISWKNNEFIFAKSTKDLKEDNAYKNLYITYKVPDFKYYIDSAYSDFFLIFHDSTTFTYFDGIEKNISPKVNVEKKNWYAFNLIRENLGDKIILYDTRDYFYVYNIKKKLLQKIE